MGRGDTVRGVGSTRFGFTPEKTGCHRSAKLPALDGADLDVEALRDGGVDGVLRNVAPSPVVIGAATAGKGTAPALLADPARVGADDEVGVDAVHRLGVARRTERDDPARDADVGLHDAPVVEDDGAGGHGVGSDLGAGGRARPADARTTLPPPNTASSPASPGLPTRSRSTSMSRSASSGRAARRGLPGTAQASAGPSSGRARPSLRASSRPAFSPRRQRPPEGRPSTRVRPRRGCRAQSARRCPPRCSAAGSGAAARSNRSPGLASAKWWCEPARTGWSAPLSTVSRITGRAASSGTGSQSARIPPGPPGGHPQTIGRWPVEGDVLGAVRAGRLGLRAHRASSRRCRP